MIQTTPNNQDCKQDVDDIKEENIADGEHIEQIRNNSAIMLWIKDC